MNDRITFIDLAERQGSLVPELLTTLKGKFVQLRHEELGEFIVFAPLELCPYHAQIVNMFSELQTPQWAFELNLRRDDGILHEEKAEIVGGGHFEILEERRRLNLSGHSLAYGDYDAYGLPEKLNQVERFKDYKIFC